MQLGARRDLRSARWGDPCSHTMLDLEGEMQWGAGVGCLAVLVFRCSLGAQAAEGLSEEQVVARTPSRVFDDQWGMGFLSPEAWVRQLYVMAAAVSRK